MRDPAKDISPALEGVLGEGQKLALIIGVGPDRPSSEKHLLIVEKGASRVLNFDGLLAARWQASGQLVIQAKTGILQSTDSVRGTAKVLTAQGANRTSPFPAPVGTLLLLHRLDPKKGLTGIEVVDTGDPKKPISTFSYTTTPTRSWGTAVAWSPEGAKVAVSLLTPSTELRGLTPHIAILDLAKPSAPTLIEGQSTFSVTPLVWLPNGIFAKRDGGAQPSALMRCSLSVEPCEVVYEAAKDHVVTTATALGTDGMLVAVRDASRNPFELRANELYLLRLSTKEVELLLRLPDDTYINAMDSFTTP